jgi:hypothetical protein
MSTKEFERLQANKEKKEHWRKWGPYLSERQWGTVREDYSPDGNAWRYFPHDHSRSRAYRWGEDGIAGISDNHQHLCFALAMWNGKDAILKERLYGLNGPDGNHGEDVKELYYYLDNLPSHAYMKYLYKYPHEKFPYTRILNETRKRGKNDPEFEILDTGVFDNGKYFDVQVEYAKEDTHKIAIRIRVTNRGQKKAPLTLLPTLWFRNEWSFGLTNDVPIIEKMITPEGYRGVRAKHVKAGNYYLYFEKPERFLFTDNETNTERIFGTTNTSPYKKDAFHDAVINNDFGIFDHHLYGTKFSPLFKNEIGPGETWEVKLKLTNESTYTTPFDNSFDKLFEERIKETDDFYAHFHQPQIDDELKLIQRQAFAGMLWTKQFYYYDIIQWLGGDPDQPVPPAERRKGRNRKWKHLHNEDILSMPDKWEYPWFAAWDTAFHCVPLAVIDPEFAKNQLILFTREWYMAPNGQIPAYEWAFSDVNPPVHAWGALRVFETERKHYNVADLSFLKRIFHKLLLNFTWWVNRKDENGKNIFEGGFLGLDNIGVFDRSNVLPGGGRLEQADGTSWMAMYSLNMMKMAIKICQFDRTYEDVATKFYEHFVLISESLNKVGNEWIGAWDEKEGFYYDVLQLPSDQYIRLKVHSLVGLSPLYAVTVMRKETLSKIPHFIKRLEWFRKDRLEKEKYLAVNEYEKNRDILFSLIPKDRFIKLIQDMLDESEFLAPGGIRSLSKRHEKHYSITINGVDYGIDYQPGESNTELFGGNSNWRGPVWFPTNYLLIESLREYHKYFGNELKFEFPTGSGNLMNLEEIADELYCRLIGIFRKDKNGHRPVNDNHPFYSQPENQDLILFFEYFHGDNSRGVGASHQTGWTGLVAKMISKLEEPRKDKKPINSNKII